MNAQHLLDRLAAGEIIELPETEWEKSAGAFAVLEQHDTRMRGMILVVESTVGLAVVEQPSPASRVVRAMANRDEVRSFVQDRLAAYDRMWDGCGCRIDYYH